MEYNLTVFNLLHFLPVNTAEKQIFNFDTTMIHRLNDSLDKGLFYLGGQLKMTHNDFINIELIQKVREINENRHREYGTPCNSWEAISMYTSQKELEFIENMIHCYILVMKLREKA
jgi:hypothetical protein